MRLLLWYIVARFLVWMVLVKEFRKERKMREIVNMFTCSVICVFGH